LVDKRIPEQTRAPGISERDVIDKVEPKETVDGEFTALEDVAEFGRQAPAPVADFPVREVVRAARMSTDLTLGLGQVVHDYPKA